MLSPRMFRVCLVLTTILFLDLPEPLPAQSKEPRDEAAELQKIGQTRDQVIAAFNSLDAGRLATFFTTDYIDLSNGRVAVSGRERAQAGYAALFARYAADGFTPRLSVQPEQIWIDGGLAVERGRFTLVLTPKGPGETRRIERRYLEVWRQDGGAWKIACDMDNEDGQTSASQELNPPAPASGQ